MWDKAKHNRLWWHTNRSGLSLYFLVRLGQRWEKRNSLAIGLPGSRGTGKPCQLRRVTHQEATCEHSIHAQCPACATLSFGPTTTTLAAALCHGKMKDKKQTQPLNVTKRDARLHHQSKALRDVPATDEQLEQQDPDWESDYSSLPLEVWVSTKLQIQWVPKPHLRERLFQPILYHLNLPEWEKNSSSNISMFSKDLAPELLSPETIRQQRLLKQSHRMQWKVLAPIATFPKHSSGQIWNLFSKNPSAKEFRSHSL